MRDPNSIQFVAQLAKKDGPVLSVCGALFSYCSFANMAEIAQQVGVIAAAITAVLVLIHRMWIFKKDWDDRKK